MLSQLQVNISYDSDDSKESDEFLKDSNPPTIGASSEDLCFPAADLSELFSNSSELTSNIGSTTSANNVLVADHSNTIPPVVSPVELILFRSRF